MEIIELCDKIYNTKCSGCSGKKIDADGYCLYCQNDLNIKNSIDELINMLSKKTQIDEVELFYIYCISKVCNIQFINNICAKANADEYFKNKFDQILNNINNLTPEDCLYLIKLIDKDIIVEDRTRYLSIEILKYLSTNQDSIDINEQLLLVKNLTKSVMETLVPSIKGSNRSKVNYRETEDDCYGDFSGDHIIYEINLSKFKIIECLKAGDYLELLATIIHECTHALQNYQMHKSGNDNYLTLLESKEKIMHAIVPGYYKQNYNKISFEVEAYHVEYNSLLSVCEMYNIDLSQEKKQEIINKANYNAQFYLDESRTLNGNSTNVNELFESIEIDPMYLKYFPVLNVEYKLEDGIVVKKTTEEIQDDYSKISQQEKEENIYIEYLYERLIGQTKQR